MRTYWRCLDCPKWGETEGKESSDDAKHVRDWGHTTVTTTKPLGGAK